VAGVRGGGAWRGCGAGVQGGGAGRWLHCRSLQAAQLHEAPKTFRKPNQAYGRPVTSLQQSCDWTAPDRDNVNVIHTIVGLLTFSLGILASGILTPLVTHG